MPPKPLKLPKWKPPKEVKLPDEKYIVIVKPWIDSSNPAFFKALGGWLECASGTCPTIIYHMGSKRNHVIVQFPPNVDTMRLLGSHRPSEFVRGEPKFNNIRKNNQVTDVYEYNYKVHGDPSTKGWNSEYPHHGSVQDSPFKQGAQYPCPRLAPRTPEQFACNVAQPIPRDILEQLEAREAIIRATEERAMAEEEAARPAAPVAAANRASPRDLSPPPSGPSQTSTQNSVTTFTPYVPPSHLYPNPNGDIVQLPRNIPQPQIGKIGKMDPYEEEEEAKFLLQAGPVVKAEDTTFNEHTHSSPSETRVNEDTSDHPATLNHSAHTPPDTIKPEPAAPSEELCQLHDQYLALQANGCGLTVKAEACKSSLRIKQEPSDVMIQAHPKPEPVDAYVPQAINVRTPSGGATHKPPVDRVSSPEQGNVKKEKEERDDQIPRAEDERSSIPGWRRRERNLDAVFGDNPSLDTSINALRSSAQVKRGGSVVEPEPQDQHLGARVHIKEERLDDHQKFTKHEHIPSISSRTTERSTEAASRDERPYKKPRMSTDSSSSGVHVKHERRYVKREYDDHRSSSYRPSDRDRARPHTLATSVKSEPRDFRRSGDRYSYVLQIITVDNEDDRQKRMEDIDYDVNYHF
ncbi:hypothetical protein WG66_010990 [Moniliophthora roreri]|nr:hypothetical protein WG66_010990 [Moniliophthora roreri]